VKILTREIMAWTTQADGKPDEAAAIMRAAADEETQSRNFQRHAGRSSRPANNWVTFSWSSISRLLKR
jgi:hypothetical protein